MLELLEAPTAAEEVVEIEAQFPDTFEDLFKPARYKVFYGGRGGAKSWAFARALLIMGTQRPLRVLCARETQKSITESVHRLLSDQIVALGLQQAYRIKKSAIVGPNGTEFAFVGIRQNISNVKSFEGFDVVWVEEAHTVSKASWDVLIPTLRKENSEVWISFNPELETDETYKRFVLAPPPDAIVRKVNYDENPFLPTTLRKEAENLKAKNLDDYLHVYEGMCKKVVEGAVYRNEMLAVDREKRICRVPYDATKPVDTFWDLGWGDHTSIWFAQSIGFEFRLIDFLDGSQQSLQFYLKALQERPYVYRYHHLPHDARAHELGSGKSIEEQVGAVFKNCVKVVTKLSVVDGIAAARSIFGKCYFDAEKTADGVQALRHYRYVKDEKKSSFQAEPLHDWASHAADAFKYFAIAIKEPERQRKEAAAKMPKLGRWS